MTADLPPYGTRVRITQGENVLVGTIYASRSSGAYFKMRRPLVPRDAPAGLAATAEEVEA